MTDHFHFFLKFLIVEEIQFSVIEMNLPLQAYLTQASRNSTQIVSQHYSLASLDRMYIHNYTIYFKNEGILCPKDCKVKIKIQNASKILWSYEAENSYVMTPVAFDLYDTVGMCGFVIKIWEFQRRVCKLPRDLVMPKVVVYFIAYCLHCAGQESEETEIFPSRCAQIDSKFPS